MEDKNLIFYFTQKDGEVKEIAATHSSVDYVGLYAERLSVYSPLLSNISKAEIENMVRESPYAKTETAVVLDEDDDYLVVIYFNFVTYSGVEINDADVVSDYGYSFNRHAGKGSQYHDIIGDIHANADALEDLLKALGYQRKLGVYQCKNRYAVLLGDFIDRGNSHKRVIDIVRPMVEQDYATAVMGNHEFNALGYHTVGENGKPLKEHSDSNEIQHKDFLSEYPLGHEETDSGINWFKTLPLFLHGEGYRVIHACWEPDSIESIKTMLTENNQLKDEYLRSGISKRQCII
jgi:hypothetical protein